MSEYGKDASSADLPFLWEVSDYQGRPIPPMEIVRSSAMPETNVADRLDGIPIVASDMRGRDVRPPVDTAPQHEKGEAALIGAVPVREVATVVEREEEPRQQVVPPEAQALSPHEELAAQERQWLFRQVGHLHDESGIRTQEIGQFFQALGLRPAGKALVLDERHKEEEVVRRAFRKIGLNPGREEGTYRPTTGLSIIYRNPAESAADVERTYAHELAHATQGIPPANPEFKVKVLAGLIEPAAYRPPLMGFLGINTGILLEEGFARMLDANMIDVIGPNPNAAPLKRPFDFPKYIPDKYHSGAPGRHYAYGALAWETLFAKDPALMDAALASRSQPEHMREVRSRVNAFYPGLFGRLSVIRQEIVRPGQLADAHRALSARNEEGFKHGLGMVLGATKSRWEDLPEMSAAVSQRIQAKIREHERKTGFSFKAR